MAQASGANNGCISLDLYEEVNSATRVDSCSSRSTVPEHFVQIERPEVVGERIIEFVGEA